MSGPVVLVVLDGFGLGDGGEHDATAQAHGPFFADVASRFPHAQLETSGEAVGLPRGQMGNSEVGHMTMGPGRTIEQDQTRIQFYGNTICHCMILLLLAVGDCAIC